MERNQRCPARARHSANATLVFSLLHCRVPGCLMGEGLHRGTLTRTGAWQTSSSWCQRWPRLNAKFLIKNLQGKWISAPSINTQPPKILPTHNFFPWNCHKIPQKPFKRSEARLWGNSRLLEKLSHLENRFPQSNRRQMLDWTSLLHRGSGFS